MIDNILSETLCCFCFCGLFSTIYHKINFIVIIVLTYTISIENRFFLFSLIEKYCFLFFYVILFSLLILNFECTVIRF